MAARDFTEMLDQVKARLGLGDKTVVKLGKAIGKLELTAAEVERVEDAVNIELARIYAERHVAGSAHRVAHDEQTIDPLAGLAPDERKAMKAAIAADPDYDPGRRNARDDCPDCGRLLVGAREADSEVPVLVCSRLHGLKLAVAGLTPHDIVACGISA